MILEATKFDSNQCKPVNPRVRRHRYHLNSCSVFGGCGVLFFLFCPLLAQTRLFDPAECSKLMQCRKCNYVPYKIHTTQVIPCAKLVPGPGGPVESCSERCCVETLVCIHFQGRFCWNCSNIPRIQSLPLKSDKNEYTTTHTAQKLITESFGVLNGHLRWKSDGSWLRFNTYKP